MCKNLITFTNQSEFNLSFYTSKWGKYYFKSLYENNNLKWCEF